MNIHKILGFRPVNMCKYTSTRIPRIIIILTVFSCIYCSSSFVKFKGDVFTGCQLCANISFVKPNTTISKCATVCGANLECVRFVFNLETNFCTGCATPSCEELTTHNSISFVRWEHVTYRYVGCYNDNSDRVLNGTRVEDESMTNDFCFGFCIQERGYSYFGTQLGKHCFYGNTYEEDGKEPDGECTSTCSGDTTTTCGGPWKNSLHVVHF